MNNYQTPKLPVARTTKPAETADGRAVWEPMQLNYIGPIGLMLQASSKTGGFNDGSGFRPTPIISKPRG
jgi:hypothetical protein